MITKKQIIDTLELYTWNKVRIDKIEEECRSLESRAVSLQTSQGGGVQTHSNGNARYTKAVESLADTIQKRYAEELNNDEDEEE